MLFSSVTNADKKTKDNLFENLKNYFLEVATRAFDSDSERLYCSQGNKEKISILFDQIQDENEEIDFISDVRNAIKKGVFK